MLKNQYLFFWIFCLSLVALPISGQTLEASYLEELKLDRRGPYSAIKWFCEDGSMREARDPCPEPLKGWQHATYKPAVEKLAEYNHIFLDQILTGTKHVDFWDSPNQNSRLKQYQITNFLFDADDGWILEKAQNYRGAKQIEDEKEWGQEFLEWLVSSNDRIEENYLLIKMAAIDIPHGEDSRVAQKVRAYSKLLAEEESSFMNTRIKLHNNPSVMDLSLVKSWKNNQKEISEKGQDFYTKLIDGLEEMYKPFELSDLEIYTKRMTPGPFTNALKAQLKNLENSGAALKAMEACEMLLFLRENFTKETKASARVDLFDLANELEFLAMKNIDAITEESLGDMREKMCFLTNGIYGAGYIAHWEYKKIKDDFDWMQGESVLLRDLNYYSNAAQKLVIWSTQMVQSIYFEPIRKFGAFEPLSYGFVDNKIRSSLILPTGQLVESINNFYSSKGNNASNIMGIKNEAGLQALNPGYTKGRLYVLPTIDEHLDLDKNGIYAFDRPPMEMKPVAGILNVKEGNPVSHVQLLARNLGIPNALLSSNILNKLKPYNGEEVFYAVSSGGTVLLKLSKDMTSEEKNLFKSNNNEKSHLTISMDKIILNPDSLLNLSKIDASYSGIWCGPKAANLGQLKQMYPDHVVEGIVIPFGIFRDHMEQQVPDHNYTYWSYLKDIFIKESQKLEDGQDKSIVENETLNELTKLRTLIEDMPLKAKFVKNIESQFNNIFGKPIGQIPVFLRSDTNMEDLPEFTGAGLNLTLFNIVDRQEILNGIKKVWASPYTERSYQWRQQYLKNPEDVYPSILIIPSVNVDKSGVIITKGVNRGDDKDISISFSRGVGGAVEGQSAESYIVHNEGYLELTTPGRETKFRTIPPSGGSTFKYASLKDPVLEVSEVYNLYNMATSIAEKMNQLSTESNHAYDIELGLKDGFIWLFQVRPFVENNDALSSDYLKSMNPKLKNISIEMESKE